MPYQVRVIQSWLCSWMRQGVDSEEEYEMSVKCAAAQHVYPVKE